MHRKIDGNSGDSKSTIYFNKQHKFVETDATKKYFRRVFEGASWFTCVWYKLKGLLTGKKYHIIQTTKWIEDEYNGDIKTTHNSVYLVDNVIDDLINRKFKRNMRSSSERVYQPYCIDKPGSEVEDIVRFINDNMPFLMVGEYRSNDGEVIVPSALNDGSNNKPYAISKLTGTQVNESESEPNNTLKQTKSIFDRILNMKRRIESRRVAEQRRLAIGMIRSEVFKIEVHMNANDMSQVMPGLKKIKKSLYLFANGGIKEDGELSSCFDFFIKQRWFE